MKASRFISLVKPYFMQRAGESILQGNTVTSISDYMNLIILDIWHQRPWKFKIKDEKISISTEHGIFYKYKTQFPISMITSVMDHDGEPLNVGLYMSEDYEVIDWSDVDCIYNEDTKTIVTREKFDFIYAIYEASYEWTEYENTELDADIPLPTKFIPAMLHMIYDIGAPISMFEDDSQVPHYQISQRILKNIFDNDQVVSSTYMSFK